VVATVAVVARWSQRVPTSVDSTYDTFVTVVVHEMMHVLGFSGSSWPLMRDASGSPRTPRSTAWPNQVADAYLK
jgi:hypothetical protein